MTKIVRIAQALEFTMVTMILIFVQNAILGLNQLVAMQLVDIVGSDLQCHFYNRKEKLF